MHKSHIIFTKLTNLRTHIFTKFEVLKVFIFFEMKTVL